MCNTPNDPQDPLDMLARIDPDWLAGWKAQVAYYSEFANDEKSPHQHEATRCLEFLDGEMDGKLWEITHLDEPPDEAQIPWEEPPVSTADDIDLIDDQRWQAFTRTKDDLTTNRVSEVISAALEIDPDFELTWPTRENYLQERTGLLRSLRAAGVKRPSRGYLYRAIPADLESNPDHAGIMYATQLALLSEWLAEIEANRRELDALKESMREQFVSDDAILF